MQLLPPKSSVPPAVSQHDAPAPSRVAPTACQLPERVTTFIAVKQQLVLGVTGAATLAGLFELTGPLIHAVHSTDPTMLFALRAGATAAIGATGGVAVTLIESAYDTVTRAKLDALRDGARFADKLQEAKAEQRHHLPRELGHAVAVCAGTGAVLSAVAAAFPTAVVVTGATAVGLSLLYSIGQLGVLSVRSILTGRNARKADAAGEAEKAVDLRNSAREHARDAGRALLETVTVATITHHVLSELGHLVVGDHASTTTFAASSAEQLPAAMESVVEVAEAIQIAAREAAEAAAIALPLTRDNDHAPARDHDEANG